MLYKIKPHDTIQSVGKVFGYTDFKEFFRTMHYVVGHTFQTGNVVSAPSIPASPRDRPYDGQPHTDQGTRGMEFVEGLTMRDVADCIYRAFALSVGEDNPLQYTIADHGDLEFSLYDLDLSKMDPGAVIQNATCEIERMMGIFPNVPEIEHE